MGNERMKGGVEREKETPKGWFTPHVRNPEKIPIVELI